MRVSEAREAARRWVLEHASDDPGFVGAYTAGSTNWLPDDATLSPVSDVDLMIVLDEAGRRDKPGKVNQDGAMLDVTYLASAELASPEALLGNFQLGPSLRSARIVADPSGRLTALQQAVATAFAHRRWVDRRRDHVRSTQERYLSAVPRAELFHENVTCWAFGTSLTTDLLLIAGLKNPTVRRRYDAARDLLAEHGRLDVHEALLVLLGCATWTRAQTETHLNSLAETFDTAVSIGKTHFFFSSELTAYARPIAIDGSRALIEAGRHREAVFWIVATQARCQKVLHYDGTDNQQRHHEIGFRALLADLGIRSVDDLIQRSEAVRRRYLEDDAVADAIMTATPEIIDG